MAEGRMKVVERCARSRRGEYGCSLSARCAQRTCCSGLLCSPIMPVFSAYTRTAVSLVTALIVAETTSRPIRTHHRRAAASDDSNRAALRKA